MNLLCGLGSHIDKPLAKRTGIWGRLDPGAETKGSGIALSKRVFKVWSGVAEGKVVLGNPRVLETPLNHHVNLDHLPTLSPVGEINYYSCCVFGGLFVTES